MRQKIAIQMDDIRTIDYTFDSSFMIGLEGQKRNYQLSGFINPFASLQSLSMGATGTDLFHHLNLFCAELYLLNIAHYLHTFC